MSKNSNSESFSLPKNHSETNFGSFLMPISLVLSSVIIAVSLIFSTTVIAGKLDKLQLATSNVAVPNTAAQPLPTPTGPQLTKTNIDDDPILGDRSKAKVAIVEFSDYECPFCKRHYTQTSGDLKKNFIDNNKAILVFRDNPLDFHDPLATQQAIAAECVQDLAGDKKYYEYHDLLFETTTSNGKGMEKAKLYELATKVDVDKEKFTQCLDTEKFKDEVKKDLADGQKAGVSGTPGFIIGVLDKDGNVDGEILSGAYPYSEFEKVINKYLDKTK